MIQNNQVYNLENQGSQQIQQEDDKLRFGFKFRYLPLFNTFSIIGSIMIGYYIAVKQGHTPPYPGTDITHTTIYYPEYYFARIGFPLCCVVLALTWYIMVFFLNNVAHKANIIVQNQQIQKNGQVDNSKLITIPYVFILIFGTAASILFLLSICVISDGGKMPDGDLNMHLHIVGASGFFVCSYLVVLTISYQYMKLWKVIPNFVHKYSYQYKVLFFYVVILLLTVDAYLSIFYPEVLDDIMPDHAGNIIEWWGTAIIVIYFLTFYYDFKNISLYLDQQFD